MKKLLLITLLLIFLVPGYASFLPKPQQVKHQIKIIIKKSTAKIHQLPVIKKALKNTAESVLQRKIKFTPGFKLFLIYISLVVLGVFFDFFFLHNFVFVGEYIKAKFFKSVFWGALAIPLSVVLFTVLAGTVLGFFFLPALMFILIFYLFFSFYTIAMLVGEQFVKVITLKDHPYFEQFLGISILFFISIIPYAGPVFLGLFMLAGLGAVVKLKFGVR